MKKMKVTPISENLRNILNTRGLKQKYLAMRTGLNEGQISNLLNGRKTIDEPIIISLAEALDVDFNTLFGYKP